MNKPVYLGLLILDLRKTVMCEFWLNEIKPKHSANAKLFDIDTESFIVNMKTDDTYKDIAEYIENAKLLYMDTDNFTIHVKTDDTY